MENQDRVEAYAEALWQLACATGLEAGMEAELARALDVLDHAAEVQAFLQDPRVTDLGKQQALLELLEQKAHPVLVHFLLTLVTERAWHRLKPVAEAFFRRAGAARHGKAGELRTAMELGAGDVAKVEAALAERLGVPVRLHQRVDPHLLGGIAVRIGDEVFDGSVQGGLERIREALLA